MNDVMHRKFARRILGILKKSVSWVLRSEEKGWLSLARRIQASVLVAGATRVGVGRWKSQNRKNVYLSPIKKKQTLNSKVMKSFVPELRSHKCFSYFGIPMFYEYMLWIIYVRFTYPYLTMVHIDPLHMNVSVLAIPQVPVVYSLSS